MQIIEIDFRFKWCIIVVDNKATFYDNDNGFVTVAKYKNGELQTFGHHSPKWLLELIGKMQ